MSDVMYGFVMGVVASWIVFLMWYLYVTKK